MGNKFEYVSLPNIYYLMEGLSFKAKDCADVLDVALIGLNKKTGIPDKIVSWNKRDDNKRQPFSFPNLGRIIVELSERIDRNGRRALHSFVFEVRDTKETAPTAFFTTKSVALNVPMRVEVPLRALIKGGTKLKGSYSVYLHALVDSNAEVFVYYGITKRGWSLRLTEHTKAALESQSRRLFPLKLNGLIEARLAELDGRPDERPKLARVISAICAVGLDEDAAMDAEEYLVDKYSLSSKHPKGLNMIPGGREGIRALHKLSLLKGHRPVETEDREEILDEYLRRHPQYGVPKPGIAEKWNDPAYAEAVICARENRLTPDQVREIRYLAAMGASVDQIRLQIDALNEGQVRRVIADRTYTRIR